MRRMMRRVGRARQQAALNRQASALELRGVARAKTFDERVEEMETRFVMFQVDWASEWAAFLAERE